MYPLSGDSQNDRKTANMATDKFAKFVILYYYSCFENYVSQKQIITEASFQKCSYKKLFWKYEVNLQETTYAEVWFQ